MSSQSSESSGVSSYYNVQIECAICMDCIITPKNKVTTECGHTFHTNCLMANVACNGFGCPLCRTMMAEEPEDSDDDSNMSEISVEDSINSSMRGLTEAEYVAHLALTSVRRLFREAGDEEEEEEEEQEEEEYVPPPIEFITQKLMEKGVTMQHLVKVLLADHAEYDAIEEECLMHADQMFDAIHAIIANFRPVVPEEPKTDIDGLVTAYIMRSSYN